jgi:hypothetical protein
MAVLTLLVFLKVILLHGGVIILNSLSSYKSAKAYVTPRAYTEINLFPDNNAPGQTAMTTFFPDLNDALVAGHQPVWT